MNTKELFLQQIINKYQYFRKPQLNHFMRDEEHNSLYFLFNKIPKPVKNIVNMPYLRLFIDVYTKRFIYFL